MRNIDLAASYREIYENRRAARNPESQGTDKKYDRVRGERTPMPPRGDKRREDFEKWYAKQMGEDIELAWEEYQQLDEVAPLIAAAAGGLAKAGAAKAATAGAAKMGGGLAKAAGSKMGKAAINAGSSAVGNSVERKMSEEVEELDEEGKKDACYNKVKSRYKVWPSAYASGALVKCRQKGAANWGNSSKKEDLELATDVANYLIELGLNEEGVEHLIEELGLNEFVDFVADIGESQMLTEARAGGVKIEPKSKAGKPVASMKGGGKSNAIKRLRADKEKARAHEKESSGGSGMKDALRKQSIASAKAKQPPKKKGMLDKVAGAVLKGMERHNKAMSLAKETGKTISKAARGAGQVAKGVADGVKTAGKAVKDVSKAVSEEAEAVFAVLIGEGIAHNEESAINIINHMSDEWYNAIVDEILSEMDYANPPNLLLNKSAPIERKAQQPEKRKPPTADNKKGKRSPLERGLAAGTALYGAIKGGKSLKKAKDEEDKKAKGAPPVKSGIEPWQKRG